MCLSITSSSFFAPSKEYVCSMKDMQICGLRWMWLSDVSYNLSDMLFQWRIWGGHHETFIWEEWLRRDIDENRDDRKRDHNSKKGHWWIPVSHVCVLYFSNVTNDCIQQRCGGEWKRRMEDKKKQQHSSIQGEMSNYNNGPIINTKLYEDLKNQ